MATIKVYFSDDYDGADNNTRVSNISGFIWLEIKLTSCCDTIETPRVQTLTSLKECCNFFQDIMFWKLNMKFGWPDTVTVYIKILLFWLSS